MKINYTRRIKENIFALMWRTRDEFQLAENFKWTVETDTNVKTNVSYTLMKVMPFAANPIKT